MKAKGTRWMAAIVLIAYSALLIRLIVFKAIPIIRVGHLKFKFAGGHTGASNLIPFKTIASELVGRGNHLISAVNLLGNILPFVPLGLLLPLVFRLMSWPRALMLGVLTGLTCEVMEVVFHVGIFDMDDVMLNALGVLSGYGVFVLFKRRRHSVNGFS